MNKIYLDSLRDFREYRRETEDYSLEGVCKALKIKLVEEPIRFTFDGIVMRSEARETFTDLISEHYGSRNLIVVQSRLKKPQRNYAKAYLIALSIQNIHKESYLKVYITRQTHCNRDFYKRYIEIDVEQKYVRRNAFRDLTLEILMPEDLLRREMVSYLETNGVSNTVQFIFYLHEKYQIPTDSIIEVLKRYSFMDNSVEPWHKRGVNWLGSSFKL